MPDNDRLEREIEEILGKIEQFPDEGSRSKRRQRRNFNRVTSRIADVQQGFARQMARMSVSQVMLLSFLIILGAFFFRGRGLPPVMSTWFLVAGVVLFISAFAMMVFARGSTGGTVQQNWRGKTVEYSTTPSVVQRLRLWWRSRAHRR